MNGFFRVAAVLLVASLAGCGSAGLFRDFSVPESPSVEEAPWPRLVDTPAAPSVGTYTEDVPDPAIGVATVTQLSLAAEDAAARAEALKEPALTEAERRRLTRR